MLLLAEEGEQAQVVRPVIVPLQAPGRRAAGCG